MKYFLGLSGAAALRMGSESKKMQFGGLQSPLAEPQSMHVNTSDWLVEVIDCDPSCLPSEFCYKPLYGNSSTAPECKPRLEEHAACDEYDGFYHRFVCGEGLGCGYPKPVEVLNDNVTDVNVTDVNGTVDNATVVNSSVNGTSFLQRRFSRKNATTGSSSGSFAPPVDNHYLQCVPCGGVDEIPCPQHEMIEGWLPDWMPVPAGLREMLKTHPAPVMRVLPDAEICVDVEAAHVHCPTNHSDDDITSPHVNVCAPVSEVAPNMTGVPLQGSQFFTLEQDITWLAEEYAMFSAGEHACGGEAAINIPIPHTTVDSLHEDPHHDEIQHMIEDGTWYTEATIGEDLEDMMPYVGQHFGDGNHSNHSNVTEYEYHNDYYQDHHEQWGQHNEGEHNGTVNGTEHNSTQHEEHHDEEHHDEEHHDDGEEEEEEHSEPKAKAKAKAPTASNTTDADASNNTVPAADLLPMANPEFPMAKGVGYPGDF